jgi:alpha-D-ribose 1-methylphosphonate 5-triphosphate synthase subunit PhnI
MYVAVKGGEKAIEAAHALLAEFRRGDATVPEISAEQISGQLALAVNRVMAEGSLYDRQLAAMAIRQARGDLIEAIFLIRASRTTLVRFGYSEPLDTAAMQPMRRISATFKDIPGGQILGPTFDYTHRLIEPLEPSVPSVTSLKAEEPQLTPPATPAEASTRVTDLLEAEGLIEPSFPIGSLAGDITREPLEFPAGRDLRLQCLSRGDEGFLLALAYSTQRGYGRTHPFAGEIRFGEVEVLFTPEELGFTISIGDIEVTECEMVNQFTGGGDHPPQFTRGYGLVFGQLERKAMSMALIDRALRADEFGETRTAPAQDEEFVLAHTDNVQATGFVEHLKLPHYVDFQAELDLLRTLRGEWEEKRQPQKDAAE